MKKQKKRPGRRNSGSGSAPAAPHRRSVRSYIRRSDPPDWKTTLAAIVGGAGSAALSGLIVNQKILSPEASAVGMIGIGGATAYFADGNARVVGNSVASAGAGQLALALLGRRALAAQAQAPNQAQPPTQTAAVAPAALPAATASDMRKAAHGGGYVTALFRDAASDLDALEDDEWRMGVRDADLGGADVYDLEDLVAA